MVWFGDVTCYAGMGGNRNKTPLNLFPQSFLFCAVVVWSTVQAVKGVSFVNSHVLGNLCEYRHKTYIKKTRFFGPHFCRTA